MPIGLVVSPEIESSAGGSATCVLTSELATIADDLVLPSTDEVSRSMRFDPWTLAVEYYFGDLQYWKLPRLAADALEAGCDGAALRRLAALADRKGTDIREDDFRAGQIDAAFREMGVNAPIAKEKARLILAVESAQKALYGSSNVFDEATYIRIHLCKLSDPPDALREIVNLSKEARNAPRSRWSRIEADLHQAFTVFLNHQAAQAPK